MHVTFTISTNSEITIPHDKIYLVKDPAKGAYNPYRVFSLCGSEDSYWVVNKDEFLDLQVKIRNAEKGIR